MRRDDAERMRVVLREVVGDAGDARVHVGAAQLLGADDLAGRGLHQRRAAEEDRALVAHDDRSRRSSPARRRRRRCTSPSRTAICGMPCGRHVGLVVEDAAEVLAVGEDLVLVAAGWRRPSRRGRCTAGGSRARFPARADASSPSSGSRCRPSPSRRCTTITHSRPVTRPMPVMMPAPRRVVVVHAVARRAATARGTASPDRAARARARAAAACRARRGARARPRRRPAATLAICVAQVVDQRAHRLGVALEGVGTGVDLRGKDRHVRVKLPGPRDRCKPAVSAYDQVIAPRSEIGRSPSWDRAYPARP